MKLNKIFLLAGIAAAGVLASCSSDDDYEKGAVATGNQLQAVTFGDDNIYSAELDPADPTELTITVYRDAEHAKEAASVPLKVITNTDDVFEVPATAEFAAGSAETIVTVTFADTEIGVPYSLEVGIDDEYVNPYVSVKTYAIEIQRVKWNPLGLCEYYDEFMNQDLGYYVEIQQRDGTNTFRLLNPYEGANADMENWAGDLSQSADKVTFTIMNAGDVDEDGNTFYYVTFNSFATGFWYAEGAMVHAYLPSELAAEFPKYDDVSADDDEFSVYYPDYGTIILTPYFFVPNLKGGFGEYPITIVLPHEGIPADAKAGDRVPEADDEENEETDDEAEVKSRVNVRNAKFTSAIRSSKIFTHTWKR